MPLGVNAFEKVTIASHNIPHRFWRLVGEYGTYAGIDGSRDGAGIEQLAMHFRRARGKLIIGQRAEAMPNGPNGVAFSPRIFQVHLPTVNHVRVDGTLVGEQHKILCAWLVALGVNGREVFSRSCPGCSDNALARLGHEIFKCLEALVHLNLESAVLLVIWRGLESWLQSRLRCTAEDTI